MSEKMVTVNLTEQQANSLDMFLTINLRHRTKSTTPYWLSLFDSIDEILSMLDEKDF